MPKIKKKLWFALAGLPLLAAGYFLQNLEPYRPLLVTSGPASCRMSVDVVEPVGGTPQGYVVLFHGVAANRRIMAHIAQDLANQNLRVFAPDFPGHGRTAPPFNPVHASECGEALVKELIERHAIVPEQTIVAGHSMGGAIAMRVSARVQVAGVIAISPAPMRATPSVQQEFIFFPDDPPLAKNTLILFGAREPERLRAISQAKVTEANDATSQFQLIPHATHVSVLFDDKVLDAIRTWNKKLLGTDADVVRATNRALAGFLCGLLGLILLCVPFIGEIGGGLKDQSKEDAVPISPTRVLGQVIVASVAAVVVLKFWVPLRILGLFQGDYLASFALLEGLILLTWNAAAIPRILRASWGSFFAACIGAIALVLLFGLWLDYSFYEAWLTVPRWLRLAPVAAAFFPWILAEELFLGAHGSMSRVRRLIFAMVLRAICWGVIVGALFFLHSGQILMLLLAAYFVILAILTRLAMDVVRRETQSPAATAVFGAILSAGFALAIFPLA
ncbi:MAG TPA: alpha/beta fold hydrolase [Candidatus Acidoferrum sp.]|nr:alpha/beta fold hydrolase [Candidatus Acidoferrum sp.]